MQKNNCIFPVAVTESEKITYGSQIFFDSNMIETNYFTPFLSQVSREYWNKIQTWIFTYIYAKFEVNIMRSEIRDAKGTKDIIPHQIQWNFEKKCFMKMKLFNDTYM